ncbi:MAG: metallophosphoesterase [Ruminococcus sp.]|nr:metallophosphoesterase [Ruminococcus sp.]MDY3896062.1 metallophosphoesterase [Candidatus Fimenecus sp.]
MKKILKTVLRGKYSALIFALISAVGILLNYSYRFGYVFVDSSVFKYFTFILFILSIVCTAFLAVVSSLNLKGSKAAENKVLISFQYIAEIFLAVMVIYDLVNVAVGGRESFCAALGLFKDAFPIWLGTVCIVSTLFVIPNLSKKPRTALTAVTALIAAFAVYASLFPISPFAFTALPGVFDNGSGYSVVFATNDNATGYIEYDYNGEHIKKYDENNGRKFGNSKIHSVSVPYEHLSQNSYKVGATRVIDELSYGGRTGKTIESDTITFNDKFDDNINVLTVSDWHTHNKKAEKAVSYLGDYNAVILLGDCAPGVMFEDDISNFLLAFASDLTHGTMPVIFVRGNHETRGRMAAKLPELLKFDKLYYETKLGDYSLIVLDSGEDKKDSHPEYGGMDAYEQNRTEMVEWLNTLENNDNNKTVALSHDNGICIEDNLSAEAHNKLDELGVSFLASGHAHKTEFKNTAPYPVLIDGGIDANGKGTYVASMLKITSYGIGVTSIDSNGVTTVDETVAWRQ